MKLSTASPILIPRISAGASVGGKSRPKMRTWVGELHADADFVYLTFDPRSNNLTWASLGESLHEEALLEADLPAKTSGPQVNKDVTIKKKN